MTIFDKTIPSHMKWLDEKLAWHMARDSYFNNMMRWVSDFMHEHKMPMTDVNVDKVLEYFMEELL